MQIKFQKVKIHNFMSFADATIDLNNQGYTFVIGVNNNKEDNAKSNGAGKSAIWEAIVFCLTGETIRGNKDIVNIHTEGGCSVELDFVVDDIQYKIIRYKDNEDLGGSGVRFFVNGVDKSGKGVRDTAKIIEEYLPNLNSELVGSVIILGQGLPQRFTNNTPSGRKEMLEKLSKSDFMIEDIKDRLNNRKDKLSTDLSEKENVITEINTIIKTNTTQKEDTENKLNLIINDNTDYEKEIENIQKEKEDIANTITKTNETIKIITQDIKDKREQYSSVLTKRNEALLKIQEDSNKDNEDLITEKSNIQQQMAVLKNDIDKKDSITDICPTCGQKIIGVTKPDTTHLKAEYEQLNQKLDNLTNQINYNKQNVIKQSDVIKEEYKVKLDNITTEGTNLSAKLDELNTNITELNQKNNAVNDKLIDYTTKFKSKNALVEEYKKTISDCEYNIKSNNEKLSYTISERDSVSTHLDIIKKLINITSRDFRGYLLLNVINYISNKTKEYAEEIFGNSSIDFKLDGNNIYIGCNEKSYESLSGGEKQKVDLIIQFAIRDMLCQYLNFNSNILVVDEIFDNLDSIGVEKVLNLITKKLSNIENIFIISHHSNDLNIPVDNTITIIKNSDGISEAMQE